MRYQRNTLTATILAGLFCACAGCEVTPGFQGKLEVPSGQSFRPYALLESYNSFEQPLPDGRRLIVLDMYEPNDQVPALLVLMIKRTPGWASVNVSGGDSEAWLIDRYTAPANGPLSAGCHEYFKDFAARSPAERASTPHCTSVTGVVELDSEPVDIQRRYAIRVSLASKSSGASMDGWFARSIVPHPENAFLAMALIPYLASGAPPP